ncbi:MAG TPA: heavy metal-binding domain-containing protein [Polyangia bacterium]|jgi:rubrerythrin
MRPAGLGTEEWSCPLHPAIVQPEPGVCPICGTPLEPRTLMALERACSIY